MASQPKAFGPLHLVMGFLLLGGVLLAWWLGWGDRTPTKQQAESFLAWGFRNQSDGVAGLSGEGQPVRLKADMVSGLESVECKRISGAPHWLSRKEGWASHTRPDCIYRLRGAGGQEYWTVIGTTYFPTDTYGLVHVAPYMLSFWAAEPDQRRILGEHGVGLPVP